MNKEEIEKLKEAALKLVELHRQQRAGEAFEINTWEDAISSIEAFGNSESDDVKHWRGVAEDYIAKYENSVLRLKELAEFTADNTKHNTKLREKVQQLNIKLQEAYDTNNKLEAINDALSFNLSKNTPTKPDSPPAPSFAVGDRVECDIVGTITRIHGDIALIYAGGLVLDRRDIKFLTKI